MIFYWQLFSSAYYFYGAIAKTHQTKQPKQGSRKLKINRVGKNLKTL
jgi:hypothetical protein